MQVFYLDSWYTEVKMSEATIKQQQQEKPLGKSSLRLDLCIVLMTG